MTIFVFTLSNLISSKLSFNIFITDRGLNKSMLEPVQTLLEVGGVRGNTFHFSQNTPGQIFLSDV